MTRKTFILCALAMLGGATGLIRSWSVLGQPHKSREALRLARKALGNNAQIEALAHTLGLEKP